VQHGLFPEKRKIEFKYYPALKITLGLLENDVTEIWSFFDTPSPIVVLVITNAILLSLQKPCPSP